MSIKQIPDWIISIKTPIKLRKVREVDWPLRSNIADFYAQSSSDQQYGILETFCECTAVSQATVQ